MTKKKSNPQLRVFLDTSALYSKVASELFRASVKNLIKENSDHVDLDIVWLVPRVVLKERRYQMLAKARELLPNLLKMEALLGHAFGIGEGTLALHVDKVIDSELKALQVQVGEVDYDQVEWSDIVERAADRFPPFESGDKEKGFRDAIISQAFLQAVSSAPATPSICRLVMVSPDVRLIEYLQEKTASSNNVRFLSDVDELEGLINTLVSNVSEEFADQLSEKASKLFFVKDSDKSLYYKEGVRQAIEERFSDVLSHPKFEGLLRKNLTWWISDPIFLSKKRQRVHWITMVEPEFELYHFEDPQTVGEPTGSFPVEPQFWQGALSSRSRSGSHASRGESPFEGRYRKGLLSDYLLSKTVTDAHGRDRFEVRWSASISAADNLVKPSIDEIKYIGDTL